VIVFFHPETDEVIGAWWRDGDTIVSDASVQDILDASLARTGSVGDTWAEYASWSNGYLSSAAK
jgi:hypothetical protein